MSNNKSVCSCCGLEYEIDGMMLPNFYSVCPRCYWEEDPTVKDEKQYSDVNKSTLLNWKNAYNLGQANRCVTMVSENEDER